METQKTSIKNIAVTFGLLLALFSILTLVANYTIGDYPDQSTWISVVSILATIAIIVFGIKKFKVTNGGFLSLGEAIKVGLAIAVISGIIVAIYNYIFMTVIEPDFVNQSLEVARTKMIEQNPDMTEEQMEMALNMSSKFMTPGIMSTFAILGSLFIGFIISLIAGLIMKQNRPEFQ